MVSYFGGVTCASILWLALRTDSCALHIDENKTGLVESEERMCTFDPSGDKVLFVQFLQLHVALYTVDCSRNCCCSAFSFIELVTFSS